ncbi:TonB-dependent receptor [Sphingobacterium mizutaii]|uniref:TonB-dependent receptor n=1 Tax=Sphingobacterium mizutaii TaxID=1010 RepID=UPI0028A99E4A|nr:TonB-dependent receptor [Sphingobacterium mizutaii]
MKTSYLLALLGATTIYTAANAQTTVKGKVSSNNNESISGLNIKVKDKVTMSDADGYFELYVPFSGSFNLEVSGVGYVKESVFINPKETNTNVGTIVIKPANHHIQEVEVTGYNSLNDKVLNVGKAGILDRDLPQAVQIVNAQVIEDQQINRLSDALKNANGVAMGANRGGVNENFFARGYSLGSNNIFKNGARTNNGGSIEASTLESVEILKGSAAILYGGVTGGAVVNLVTKKPKFEYGGEVSMRMGSYNQYKPIVDVYGPISKNLAFRVVGTGEYAESYRDYVVSKRYYINPSLLYKMSEKSSLNFMFDYLKSDYTPDFGIGSVDGKINKEVGRNTFINTPWAFNKTNSSNGQINFEHVFSDNWNLQAIASYQQYGRDYYGSERIQAKATGMAARALNRTEQDELSFNQQLNVKGTVQTGAIKHQILVGADADQSNTKNYAFNIYGAGLDNKPSTAYDSINVFNPYTAMMRSDMPGVDLKTRTTTDINRYGIFAQDLISLTKEFKILAGIRYTYQKTKNAEVYDYATGETTITPNKGKDGEDMGSKVDKAWSPKLALIYQPIPTMSVYASYANNFTSNTGYDVNFQPMGPSLIDQYEAGIKNDFFNGRLSANLTWYRIQNNKFAQTIIEADGTVKDPNMKEFTGKTASDGVELDLTGKLAEGLNVMAGYSYNFMRYLETNDNGNVEGVRLVGTTAHSANGTIFYTLQNGSLRGLKLGFSTFYTGKRNAGWNNTKLNEKDGVNRLIAVDPFTTFDFSAGYTYRNWSILGKVSNIGNAFNYYVHENYSVNPIPPRSFTGTLSYKF